MFRYINDTIAGTPREEWASVGEEYNEIKNWGGITIGESSDSPNMGPGRP